MRAAAAGWAFMGGPMLLGSSGCYPLPPFVIGKEGGGYEDDGEDAEEKLHDIPRIA